MRGLSIVVGHLRASYAVLQDTKLLRLTNAFRTISAEMPALTGNRSDTLRMSFRTDGCNAG